MNRPTRPIEESPDPDHAHSRRRSGGVTLLELLVAIALLGLIAGIGVVSLRTDAPSRDSATARAQRLAARLATARNEAIRSGQAVTIYVDDRPRDAQPHGDAVNGVLVATAQPDGSLLLDEAFAAAVAVGRLDGEVRPEADRARR